METKAEASCLKLRQGPRATKRTTKSGEAAASEQFVDIRRMSTNCSFAATSIFLPLHDLMDEGVDEGVLQCAWMTSNATEVKPSKPLLLSVSETCTQTEEQSLPGPQGNTCSQ